MKFLKWVMIVVIAIPVLFVVRAFIHTTVVGPEGWAMDNTENRLKAKMKDPESMVIRSSFIVKVNNPNDKTTTISICGIVDGKNGFGGYTGGTRFMSRSVSDEKFNTFDTHEVEMDNPDDKRTAESVHMLSPFENVYWNPNCVDAEHPALTVAK